MKIFKMALPLVAFVLAIAASAFTTKDSHVSPNAITWQFQGDAQDDPNDPTLYVKLSQVQQPLQCNEGAVVCRIMADENGSTGHPDLSAGDPSVEIDDYSTTFRSE